MTDDLYARCAAALNITRAEFAAWIDGDPFAGYDLDAISDTLDENTLENLRDAGIITAAEYATLTGDDTMMNTSNRQPARTIIPAQEDTTMTTPRSYYAVYSPRGFANEVTVTEHSTREAAKAQDAGFSQKARARYIREYNAIKAEHGTPGRETLIDPRTGEPHPTARGTYTFVGYE